MAARKVLPWALAGAAGILLGVAQAPLWAGIITVCVISPVGCWIYFGPFTRAAGEGDT